MAVLAAAAPYIAAGLGVYNTVAGGRAAEDSGKANARALRARGISEEAIAQHQAEQIRRRTNYLQSRAQAVAAASGAGATDKTVFDVQGGIEKEGEYDALAALWSGANSRASNNYAAQVVRSEGRQASKNANIMAMAQAISFGASQYALHQTPGAVPASTGATPRDIAGSGLEPQLGDMGGAGVLKPGVPWRPQQSPGFESLAPEQQEVVQSVIGQVTAEPVQTVKNLNPVPVTPPLKPPSAPTPGASPAVVATLNTRWGDKGSLFEGKAHSDYVTADTNTLIEMTPLPKRKSRLEELADALGAISNPDQESITKSRAYAARRSAGNALSMREKYGKE